MVWTRDGWLRLEQGGNMAAERIPESRLCEDSAQTFSGAADNERGLLFGLYTPRINPAGFVNLKAREGWLRVRGQESFSSLNRSSILAHKLTAIHAQASVKLEMDVSYYQAYAGIMIYYDNMDYAVLRKAYSEKRNGPVLDILIVDNGNRSYIQNCETPVENGTLCLKVVVDGRRLQFYWSYEGGDYQSIGPALDTSHYSDEYCKNGEFTGAFLGIGCSDSLLHSACADFALFEYRVMES